MSHVSHHLIIITWYGGNIESDVQGKPHLIIITWRGGNIEDVQGKSHNGKDNHGTEYIQTEGVV